MNIQLTVQPHSKGQYRLGINKHDSELYFKRRRVSVVIKLNGHLQVLTKTTCGYEEGNNSASSKKGYDVCDPKLSGWITTESFNEYDKGQPTKLIFKLVNNDDVITLDFVGKAEKK